MTRDSSLHERRRAPTPAELAGIPWLALLTAEERDIAVAALRISEAQPGDLICRVGRPVTYWFGVVDGLLKMSGENADGQTLTFAGLPPGGWFGEGTVLKREAYRYNVQT
ncbi:MAG: cyclic nucleotide-binding domain-containing protein, partial [Rhodoferax sp.]|nr:cyclic nucleotide-binding domain-containing protein [Rhodoferax sp.]